MWIKILLVATTCAMLLTGCSNNAYQSGYDDGYYDAELEYENDYDSGVDDGYSYGYENGYDDGYYDGCEDGYEEGYEDGLHVFRVNVAELMYDHEYEVVKKLAEYSPEDVEDALEFEFGVKDIAMVIEYLQTLSETVTGTCEICGELVYADEFAFLPDGIECAHSECVA